MRLTLLYLSYSHRGVENLDKEQLKTLLAYALDHPRKIPASERSSRQPFEDRTWMVGADRYADLGFNDYEEEWPIGGLEDMAADDMAMNLMM